MNLPNKLTMLRMFMIPVFLFFFLRKTAYVSWMPHIRYNYLLALIIFAAASITDLIDGKIARSRGLVTDFGKLMDPLADKLLVTSALCCLLPGFGVWGTVSLILILSREFLVTSIRLIAAGKGEVLAADIWGKVKTVVQMSWIVYYLLLLAANVIILPDSVEYPTFLEPVMPLAVPLHYILFAAMVLLTVLSGAHYVVKNRRMFAG